MHAYIYRMILTIPSSSPLSSSSSPGISLISAYSSCRYVQMFIGFLRDVAAMSSSSSLDISEPLYIIELGTGSGKFSFYFVQWLEQMETILPFPLRQIRSRATVTSTSRPSSGCWPTSAGLPGSDPKSSLRRWKRRIPSRQSALQESAHVN